MGVEWLFFEAVVVVVVVVVVIGEVDDGFETAVDDDAD
jgi:hypothetical protein